MRVQPRLIVADGALAPRRTGRMSRRRIAGLLGALGATALAAPVMLGRQAAARSGPSLHGAHAVGAVGAQEGGAAMATPQLGERPDGTRLWKVTAGGGLMEEMIEALAFFPGEITINAGDAIYFELPGFHNVHFLSGQEAPPLIVPGEMAGTPAGGPPPLIINPEVVFPSGGTTYDGTGVVNSGVPLGPMDPFVLTFTTPGTYEYVCSIHLPVMRARVTVQEAGSPYPMEQDDYDAIAAEELTALVETARARSATYAAATPAAGGATPTTGSGTLHEVTAGFVEGQVEANAFLPRQVTIRTGDTVRWTVRSAPVTPHVVTFLGGEEALEFLVPQESAGGPPLLTVNPAAAAPAGGPIYSGQGLANSGLLGGPDGQLTYELTFDTPGTYRYYCPIHGDPQGGMIGDVIVE